ncbi:MAG: Xanthine permease [Burkholderiaceae bacterium]|jgi:xanthine permease|nr:MAG: Xanthine permease [Burkholderiaceae bacterium]
MTDIATSAAAPVNERLPITRLIPLGLQHVLVMYSSTIAVPFIVAAGLNLPKADIVHLVAADLLLCGIGTILQSLRIWKVGAQMPLVVGASFNLVAPMIVIGNGFNLQVLYGSILTSGILVFLIAPYFTKLLRFFPPLVIGVAITLIGINLIPAGLGLIFGRNPASPDYAAPLNLSIAAISMALVVFFYRILPERWAQLSILISMALGILVAYFLGAMNVSGIVSGPVIAPPKAFYFGWPQFNVVAILSLLVVWLVMMIESVGQIVAVGKIVHKRAKPSTVASALRVDGLMTALGGVFQSFGYITFTQNVGVVSLTGVKSRFVTVTAGIILVILSVFPILGRFVAAVPNAVLGGVTLIMFSTVAVIGIQILARIDFDKIGNIVAVALSLGLGTIPVLAPHAYDKFPHQIQLFMHSGVAVGSVTVILLNLIFNYWVKDRPAEDADDPFAMISENDVDLPVIEAPGINRSVRDRQSGGHA